MDDDYDYDRFADDGRAPNEARTMPRQRVPARKPRSRSLILIVGVLGVVLIGAFVAWAYLAGEDYIGGEELPVITADRSPYKVRPEEPGGMEVPNQDKEVYERVGGSDGEQVERLLPPAEEAEPPAGATAMAEENAGEMAEAAEKTAEDAKPGADLQPPPPPPVQAAAEQAEEQAAAATSEPQTLSGSDQTAQVSREELPPPPGAKTEENPTATPAAPETDTSASTTDQPAATGADQPAATAAPTAPADGDYRVQVASIQDRSKAESSWSAMQNRHEDLLGGLTLTVVEVEIEGRGTFYRLQGGGVSRTRAEEICATLKERDAGCLIVRP